MSNRRIILNLYRAKINLCRSQGYELGNWKDVPPNFNLGRSLLKLKRIKIKKNRATYVMNHVRQAYKDTINIKDKELIDAFIDEGFMSLRNFDNFLNVKKRRKKMKDDEEDYIIIECDDF